MSNGSEGQAAAADFAARPGVTGSSSSSKLSRRDRLSGVDLHRLVAAVSEPGARRLAQINEASTRLYAAVRRLQEARPGRHLQFESLERRALLSVAGLNSSTGVTGAAAQAVYAEVLPSPSARPSVTSTSPAHGTHNVLRDAFVSANIFVPSGGIDTATLNPATVKLYRASDGAGVEASVNTSAGGDVLVLGPTAPLNADTDYVFEVTDGLRDTTGDPFIPYKAVFRTGASSSASDSSLKFDKVPLDVPMAPYTGLTHGPDGRLYAAVETGEIIRFDIRPDGTLANPHVIRTLLAAHDGERRFLTGIEFDPASSANDLALWATHSHYAIDNGPDWTGKISRLSGPELATVQDYVIGLPRSTRDHVSNQITFGPDGAMYFPQASNTAMGAPDYAWHYRPERLLTAAILRLDIGLARDRLAAGVGPVNVKTEEGGTYNPYGPNAPLTIYATGVRNAYDLLWHSNGKLYAPTNGSQRGGATPAGGGVPAIDFVEQVENDYLHLIVPGGYYGHPNPSRGEFARNGGNPTEAPDPVELPQYPVGTHPDAKYRLPVYDFGQHYSPNGIIEYRGQAFAGELHGKMLVARYSGGDDIIVLGVNSAGQVVEARSGIEGLRNFNDPLDLIEDPATGFVYVAEFGGQTITLVKPSVAGDPPGVSAAPMRVPVPPYGLTVHSAGSGALELNWIDTVGETAYGIERSADGASGWTQIGATGTNETRFTDSGLPRGRSYSYRIRAANSAGASKASPPAAGTTLAISLPAGWSGADIGSVGVPGNAAFANGTFELSGAGADIAGASDAFFFASVPVTGDIEIVARVTGLEPTNPYAKAGVMIRGGTSGGAANAMMELTAGAGGQFQARSDPGSSTAHVRDGTGGAAPYWVRLVRRGDRISGYTSSDGSTWIRVSSARVALAEQVLVGLAVTAHDTGTLCTAAFDNVRINAAPPLTAPQAPSDLVATADGTRVDLTWRDNAGEATGFELERRRAGGTWIRVAHFGPDATSHADQHLASLRKYEYRVRAVNAAGASPWSDEAHAKTARSAVKGQAPFDGVAPNMPGLIEAEAFDEGPKGKAWKDRTPENDLGMFRDTGVEIEYTSDPAGGGFHIVASKTEWIEYTVNMPSEGTYAVELRMSAADGFGGTAHIEADGRKVTVGGSLTLPATGGWTIWQTAGGLINLKAGVQVLRLNIDTAAHASGQVANINWLRLSPADPVIASLSAAPKKAAFNPAPARDRIFAALFNTTAAISFC